MISNHKYLLQNLKKKSAFQLHFLVPALNYCTGIFHFDIKYNPVGSKNKFTLTQIARNAKKPVSFCGFSLFSSYTRPPTRALRKRISKRKRAASKPVLDEFQFQNAVSQLLPRFSPDELCNVITMQNDPLVCLELFNYAAQQPRFRHNVSSFHITVKKLGAARMYEEMDVIVNQVLAIRSIGSEALYNTMIYYFTEARKLNRAVNIFQHMRSNMKLSCRPSIRTYNLLFAALVGREGNSYVNHLYMQSIRGLFKLMVNDGVEPDIFSLNTMIKGYALSLHLNEALRIFHQMEVVYNCPPNSFSYDYLIHGLCAQGRTNNARELCDQMKEKGFVPSGKSYNSLVNALALGGDIDEAVKYLWEMIGERKLADFITYRTLLGEIRRHQRSEDGMNLLKDLQAKGIVDGHTCKRLQNELQDNFRRF